MNRLGQFWHYVDKVCDLPRWLRGLRDQRGQPEIPTPALSASLFLGAVLRVPALLQLQAETARRGWQRLVGWAQRISDDAFGYVLERYRLEDWRAVLVATNRRLEANRAFESAKISGRCPLRVGAGSTRLPGRCGPAGDRRPVRGCSTFCP